MNPTCAVCGWEVEENRAEVTVEWREEAPDYYALHSSCARSVLDGWKNPG